MDPSPILSIIHTVTIDGMLNNNGVNNGYGLKNKLRVNKAWRSQKRKRNLRTNIDTFHQRTTSVVLSYHTELFIRQMNLDNDNGRDNVVETGYVHPT